MEHVGPSRPASLSVTLPPALHALIAGHGAGVLFGTLRMSAPGLAEHDAMRARFEAERVRRHGSAHWLALRSARGDRVIVIGEGLGVASGSWVLFDPGAPPVRALWVVYADGRARVLGDDLDALGEAIARGVPFVATPPTWLAEALDTDAALLDAPATYDTREDDGADELARALLADDEDAADRAFEIFASVRSLPRRIVEARALVDAATTACARGYARQLERMTTRNPIAARLGALVPAPMVPTLEGLEALGLLAGGVIDEQLAAELDGEAPLDLEGLREGHAALAMFGDDAPSLSEVTALEAFAWLAAVRPGRVGGTPVGGVEPVPLSWMPSLARCWPVLVLALADPRSFRWASPHLVRLLAQSGCATLRSILLTLVVRAPDELGNGAHELAAEICLARSPATDGEVSAWIASVRARGRLPKRYDTYDAASAPALALLARCVDRPAVAAFFAKDVTRAPYVAFDAAKRAEGRASWDILHAIYTGAVPVSLRVAACELAVERGDPRARPLIAGLEKSSAAEGRRLDRM